MRTVSLEIPYRILRTAGVACLFSALASCGVPNPDESTAPLDSDESALPEPIASGAEFVTSWILGRDEGRRLVIFVDLGDPTCSAISRVVVDESADSVDIKAYALTLREDACTLEHRHMPVTVDLKARCAGGR
jgi:hypothetical protein